MQPTDLQQIGDELAIKWQDGTEGFIRLDQLRRACPCAGCQGERDVMGNLHKAPQRPLTADSFKLKSLQKVGGYAVQPTWADGHATGLYSYEYLKHLTSSAGD